VDGRTRRQLPARVNRPEGQKLKFDEVMAAECLLLGRVSYQAFVAAWPTMEGTGEFGERMNGCPSTSSRAP
jgi:hypothetical protein